jgi:hypothetical protein
MQIKKLPSKELGEAKSKEKEALRIKREAEIELLLKKKEEEAKVITAASKLKEVKKVGKIDLQPNLAKNKAVKSKESVEPSPDEIKKTVTDEKTPNEVIIDPEKSIATTESKMLMLVTKIVKMNLTRLLQNIKSYLDSNQLAKLLIYQNLNLKRKKRVHLHLIQKEREEELVSLTIMQKLLKNQLIEQLKNLTSNQRIPLLLEKSRVQRKFKNKLEKHLKNFKARVQKVRVQNTEKRKETNIVKKQKMSLRT